MNEQQKTPRRGWRAMLHSLPEKKRDGTFRKLFDDWKWIFSFSKKHRGAIVFYTLLGIFGASLSLVAAYVSKILINIIVGKQIEKLAQLIVLMLASSLFSLLTESIVNRIGLKISLRVYQDIQADIFDRILDADWLSLQRYSNGDLLSRFSDDVETVANNAIGWLPGVIVNFYTFAATFVLLFRTDPVMAWFALGTAPVLLLFSRVIVRQLREYKERVLQMNAGMTAFQVETFYHFDLMKSFGAVDRTRSRLREWQGKYRDYHLDYNRFELRAQVLTRLLSAAVSMLAFCYCLFRLWSGQILYGDMTFFLGQREVLTDRFHALVHTVPGMIASAASAHRIRELVELPSERHDTASRALLSKTAQDGLTVTVRDAVFAYREGEHIYEKGNLIARPGEIIAVLGSSGEGKTTLLRLLLGMILPEAGCVTLTDRDGNAVEMNADLRAFFSYVPQGNSLLSGTVADNLRLGNPSATEAEMRLALEQACAWEFVSRLPQKLDTVLGENGGGLSEGQAQRIAIARAILRDAPVLLLDEATSALDAETEERVLGQIVRSRPNHTLIISTHRKSVLRRCDRIYQIEQGGISELPQQHFAAEY